MESRELEIIKQFPKITEEIKSKMISGFKSSLDMNLNDTQRRTLLYIKHFEKPTMTALHKNVGREKGSLTTVIDQLIGLRLVERKGDPKDRRKVIIILTKEGCKKVEILGRELAEYIRGKLEKLPDKDREGFYHAVQTLADISRLL